MADPGSHWQELHPLLNSKELTYREPYSSLMSSPIAASEDLEGQGFSGHHQFRPQLPPNKAPQLCDPFLAHEDNQGSDRRSDARSSQGMEPSWTQWPHNLKQHFIQIPSPLSLILQKSTHSCSVTHHPQPEHKQTHTGFNISICAQPAASLTIQSVPCIHCPTPPSVPGLLYMS